VSESGSGIFLCQPVEQEEGKGKGGKKSKYGKKECRIKERKKKKVSVSC